MKRTGSGVNFVVAKQQSHDQTVGTTDRNGGPATTSGPQFRPFLTYGASVNTICVRFSIVFYGYCARVVSGVTSILTGYLGKPSTARAAPYYFDQWKRSGLFEEMNAILNQLDRQQQGREPFPSVLCIDSHRAAGRSVKLLPMSCEYRGMDAHKRVNGRKRTFVVDTQGRLWFVDVDAANRADGSLGVPLVSSILWRCGERLEKVFGDQSYNGVFAAELAKWSIAFEKAARLESARGFVPVAKRWVVEPVRRRGSIAWTNRTGDPVLPSTRQRLRIYGIIFGELAVFSEHSTNASANLTLLRSIIPQHVLKQIEHKPDC